MHFKHAYKTLNKETFSSLNVNYIGNPQLDRAD